MKSPKKDRIGCGWGVGVILLLSPLFLHLFGLLRALDILDFLLPMLSLYFFRAYYLDEAGIEAKVLFITCRKLRWEDVKGIGFETSRTGLDIRITPRHNSRSVIVLSAEIKLRVA
ncbi:MAG: hypothetical protein IIY16_01660, partial [Oscillospiraceae bacterium]|nr:hypothetical protein [Oscillospiraceae bacterium]